jgi:hypothetical protein
VTQTVSTSRIHNGAGPTGMAHVRRGRYFIFNTQRGRSTAMPLSSAVCCLGLACLHADIRREDCGMNLAMVRCAAVGTEARTASAPRPKCTLSLVGPALITNQVTKCWLSPVFGYLFPRRRPDVHTYYRLNFSGGTATGNAWKGGSRRQCVCSFALSLPLAEIYAALARGGFMSALSNHACLGDLCIFVGTRITVESHRASFGRLVRYVKAKWPSHQRSLNTARATLSVFIWSYRF